VQVTSSLQANGGEHEGISFLLDASAEDYIPLKGDTFDESKAAVPATLAQNYVHVLSEGGGPYHIVEFADSQEGSPVEDHQEEVIQCEVINNEVVDEDELIEEEVIEDDNSVLLLDDYRWEYST